MDVVALVTARGGSKGVPGKNIAPVAGKPLIAWTIEAALSARCLSRTLVSTDDAGIAAVARACGAEVPFVRPADLAGDRSSHISVVLHALDWLEGQARCLTTLSFCSPLPPCAARRISTGPLPWPRTGMPTASSAFARRTTIPCS